MGFPRQLPGFQDSVTKTLRAAARGYRGCYPPSPVVLGTTHPPEGGSKFAQRISGRGQIKITRRPQRHSTVGDELCSGGPRVADLVRMVTNSSAMVGWTATVASNCFLVAPIFNAMATSWTISPASGPKIWQPRTLSLLASTTSFIIERSFRPES